MRGFGVPSGKTMPTPVRAILISLPGMMFPFAAKAAIEAGEEMTRSDFSPALTRSVIAPMVL
jgi:hypothetical protein